MAREGQLYTDILVSVFLFSFVSFEKWNGQENRVRIANIRTHLYSSATQIDNIRSMTQKCKFPFLLFK